jgi:molybdate transport system regulatory protein
MTDDKDPDMKANLPVNLKALLTLKKGDDSPVGASRIHLLRTIGELGSISAAARAVGLSYKGAWDSVQALNNLSARPLVIAQTGGRSGGMAEVTPAGQALIRAYDQIEGVLEGYMGQVEALLGEADIDPGDFLRSLSMKTTARNTYAGVISSVQTGAVNTEVALKVSDDIELIAIITRESVEALGLRPGKSAMALIKSSFVILAAGHEPLPVSARNRLRGIISAVTEGAVNDEVTLQLDAGKTLTAVVTRQSRTELGLHVGQPAQALIKASHIILATD